MAEISPTVSETKTLFLGPFVGDITRSSVKIWLNVQEAAAADQNIHVTLEAAEQGPRNEAERIERDQKEEPLIRNVKGTDPVRAAVIRCLKSDLGTGIVTIRDLNPNTRYSYQLWRDEAHTIKLDLNPSASDEDLKCNPPRFLKPEDFLNSMFGNTFTLYSVAPVGWLTSRLDQRRRIRKNGRLGRPE